MSSRTYWANSIEHELTQGDLLRDVWVGSSATPKRSLKSGNMASNRIPTWEECGSTLITDHSGMGHFLARGRSAYAIVISHSCEIDKGGSKVPVLVAQVNPISQIDSQACENIRQGLRQAFLFLPEIEGIFPESYADLRTICYLPRAIINSCERVRSVTQDGLNLLACQVVSFVTRVNMDSITTTQPATAQPA